MLVRKWRTPLPVEEAAELLEREIPWLYLKKRRRVDVVRFTLYDGAKGRKQTASLVRGKVWERDGCTWVSARAGVLFLIVYCCIFLMVATAAALLIRQGGPVVPSLVALVLSVLFLWVIIRHIRNIRNGFLELRAVTDQTGWDMR